MAIFCLLVYPLTSVYFTFRGTPHQLPEVCNRSDAVLKSNENKKTPTKRVFYVEGLQVSGDSTCLGKMID